MDVLSADFLDKADLTSLYELQFNVPGLVVNNLGMNGAGFALRGVSDQGGGSLSVATHLDGVYMGKSTLAIARMFDMQRIEVLKGPQGTLYGRNATGGSINYITNSPKDELSAEIETAYGSFDTARIQGHVNLPSDKADFRIAFIGSAGDGYIRNSVDDRKFAESDFWGLRLSSRIDVFERLRVDLMAQHVEDDGASGELWTPSPQYLIDPSDIRLTTVTLANPYLLTEVDNISANVEYDLGFAMLQSVTGYARNNLRDLDDCAGEPFLQSCVRGVSPAKYDQWSQEIRLASKSSASFNWLVGGYYFDSDSTSNLHQFLPAVIPVPLTDAHSTSNETAIAAFGQATWQVAEKWSLTGGVRQSYEKNREFRVGTGFQDSPTPQTAEDDWDGTSWRLDLEFLPTDDMLVYAGVSTGFKSGGFTTLATGEFDTFDAENLTAYEAGVKSQWLDRRATLNGSAFYYQFDDLQVGTVTIGEGGVVAEVDNAAAAELYGIDAEGDLQVSDRLKVSGGAVWMPKRDFVDYRNELTGDTLSGNKLSRAPEWSVTAAIEYKLVLQDLGALDWRIEYNYRSDFFYTKENVPNYAQGSFGLLNIFLNFEPTSEQWHLFASARNLTDQDYFHQVLFQSTPGYPDTYEIGLGFRF